MDQDDLHDPFAGLEDWAKAAERRVKRERRLGVLRRYGLIVAGVAVVLAVAVPLVRSGLPTGRQDTAGGPEATRSAESSDATKGQDLTDPFAGTPAATYPRGAAGITLPPAKAVTGFTAIQVAAALKQVRAAMIVGRLDRRSLVGHQAAPFLGLLAPNNRKGIGRWFTTHTASSVVTWIDPAVRLDPAEQPRVSGRVAVSSVRVDGVRTLRVTTNFIWVYAFTGPEHPLAAEHDEIRWEFPSTRDLVAGDRGMWVADTRSYSAWVDCAAYTKGLLAPTKAGDLNPPGAEDPDELLKADHTLDIHGDCPDPAPSP